MDDGATLALATEDVRAELRAAVHDARERGLLYSAKWCAPRRFPLLVLLSLWRCVFLYYILLALAPRASAPPPRDPQGVRTAPGPAAQRRGDEHARRGA